MADHWHTASHESLEVGAAPVVRHMLERLRLHELFDRHLPRLPGRPPALSSSLSLTVLLTNLVIARRPLYAIPEWAARRVPEHLGLLPEPVVLLSDDRIGAALDHLHRADRARLLTALVRHVVSAFAIDLAEFHQATTTVTFSGDYADQPRATELGRPPRITFGYNKDHRPDLKQLVYGITISAGGAVPMHAKIYDGNTTDDAVHIDTWSFLTQLVGSSNFLYVADSKLCTRDNMAHIAARHGRFLTVMPRTRNEYEWFREHLRTQPVEWTEVHREPNPRRRTDPDVVYHGVESPQRSSDGYRVLWYRSSQKEQADRNARQERLRRARAALEELQRPGRRARRGATEARQAGERIVREHEVEHLLGVEVACSVEEHFEQVGPGRPGPDTEYRRVETPRWSIRFEEQGEALSHAARCDGLFPLMTNDASLRVAEALEKYKYQPFVEKRHEQLKNGFDVAPMWLKNVARVESLLWLYYVVELVGALVEREVRRAMTSGGIESLALYPEGRAHMAPTTGAVFDVLEGHRRHRLLDESGQELRRFHDPLSDDARRVLQLLGVSQTAYGIDEHN
jgi:transposase